MADSTAAPAAPADRPAHLRPGQQRNPPGKVWQALTAARAEAVQRTPYFARALMSLRPRATSAVPTMASDKLWRFYYNPDFVQSLIDRQRMDLLVSAWLHEVDHCLRQHSDRFDALHEPLGMARIWNLAADAPINYDIKTQGLSVDDTWISYADFAQQGVTEGMTTEQVYARLRAEVEPCPVCGQPQPRSQSTDRDEQDGQARGSDGQPDDSGDAAGSGTGAQSGDSDGTGQQGQGQQGRDPGGQGQQPGTGQCQHQIPVGCGSSSAGGAPQPWDEAADGDEVNAGQGELIRQWVARDIVNHARGRGNVPGDWLAWAEELLHPTVPWPRVLRAAMRRSIGEHYGRTDYSFARPSRRRVPDVVLPASVKPIPPQIEVVIDTSGSVADREITQALSEVEEINRLYGRHGNPVRVTFCDTVPADVQRVVGTVKGLQIAGRGGTDMTAGIAVAAARRPKNKIIMVMTDGETGWPEDKPVENLSAHYYACIFGGRDSQWGDPIPDWMTTIDIPLSDD